MAAICHVLTACHFPDLPDIGAAKTAAELAPSLGAIREATPENDRRLADGTFDSLSLLEQWDFVAEVQDIAQEQRETRSARFDAAWRQSIVEFWDSVETLPPELAERHLASRREELLLSLNVPRGRPAGDIQQRPPVGVAGGDHFSGTGQHGAEGIDVAVAGGCCCPCEGVFGQVVPPM